MPNLPIFKCLFCLVAAASLVMFSKSSLLKTLLLWMMSAGPCDSDIPGKKSWPVSWQCVRSSKQMLTSVASASSAFWISSLMIVRPSL